ncbi:winged helix-turn-helix domain-containing protein [Microbacterium sufflavum]|uniref:Winged helix-turn-helix domain-containing protein n=1 Tax=Microbacterium sufflavum TaxID=2851649 RepID=A0ABY4IHC8_9MICO|nr:winged helix-turn-helix domain-containing protein [Microbacterium sufflavum]UPL12153.1 winged helix-turn-helix domain-containing protein [Microbacterium sufflavum]
MSIPTSVGRPLTGCRIAIADDPSAGTAHGAVASPTPVDLGALLAAAGAEVVRVPSVRADHSVPAGVRRSVHRVATGRIDGVLLFSVEGARSWWRTVERLGLGDAIRARARASRLLLVASGAEAARSLADADIPATTVDGALPDDLARAVVGFFSEQAPMQRTDAGELVVRSGGVLLDERFLPLSAGAAEVLEALFLAEGRVLSREELGRMLAGRRRSARAVEVAVARLREALGDAELVQTVVKRGYRLAVADR